MISFRNVNLSFDDNKIINNLNLNIKEGDKFLLNQKSGCGKTTLIKTIMGFTEPDSGTITINKNIINHNNINKIRADIFYLDQDVTLPELRIKDLFNEIQNYKYNKNIYKNFDLNRLISEFQLDKDILEKNIKKLSGGERQRVGLIIGILLNRPIWLLDEPTSALDDDLKYFVKKRVESLKKTVLIISHDNCWNNIPVLEWRSI